MHLHDAAAGFIQRRMTKAAPHHVPELDVIGDHVHGRDLGLMGVLDDFRSMVTLSLPYLELNLDRNLCVLPAHTDPDFAPFLFNV